MPKPKVCVLCYRCNNGLETAPGANIGTLLIVPCQSCAGATLRESLQPHILANATVRASKNA